MAPEDYVYYKALLVDGSLGLKSGACCFVASLSNDFSATLAALWLKTVLNSYGNASATSSYVRYPSSLGGLAQQQSSRLHIDD